MRENTRRGKFDSHCSGFTLFGRFAVMSRDDTFALCRLLGRLHASSTYRRSRDTFIAFAMSVFSRNCAFISLRFATLIALAVSGTSLFEAFISPASSIVPSALTGALVASVTSFGETRSLGAPPPPPLPSPPPPSSPLAPPGHPCYSH